MQRVGTGLENYWFAERQVLLRYAGKLESFYCNHVTGMPQLPDQQYCGPAVEYKDAVVREYDQNSRLSGLELISKGGEQ